MDWYSSSNFDIVSSWKVAILDWSPPNTTWISSDGDKTNIGIWLSNYDPSIDVLSLITGVLSYEISLLFVTFYCLKSQIFEFERVIRVLFYLISKNSEEFNNDLI